jgi:L-lactate dehydrogenase
LGEHGDSMVPILSSATVGGVPILSYPGVTPDEVQGVFDFTKKSGAEVIKLKGGAGRAVGISIKEVVESIALDQEKILPVSAKQSGTLGISDVSLSLPTRVGRKGVMQIVTPVVTEAEKELLHASSDSLKAILRQLG